MATIPAGVASLGEGTFQNCSVLASAALPATLTNVGQNAFYNCAVLSAITVDPQNPSYSSVEGVLFNKTQTTLVEYPGGKDGSYIVPDGTAEIASNAFANCAGLTSVTLPDSVTNIAEDAFYTCASLTSAAIGSGVTSIGEGAFSGTSLANFTLPGQVSSIGEFTFSGCAKLASMTISASVTNIGAYAFYDCTNLSGVWFVGNAPVANSSAFLSASNAIVYYLPSATGWSSPYHGLRAVLWNPLIQASGASFGVRNGQFGFTIAGTTNIPIVVQACTNLSNPNWVSLQALTLTNGLFYFSDPRWTNYSSRFYRVSSP
jgi:hypothetical protein